MNTILYWVLFSLYILSILILFTLLGVSIKRKKIVFTKPAAVSVLFAIQYIMSSMVFGIPLGYNILINLLALISFYVGIKLQVIGLTGGIACGKSTVS